MVNKSLLWLKFIEALTYIGFGCATSAVVTRSLSATDSGYFFITVTWFELATTILATSAIVTVLARNILLMPERRTCLLSCAFVLQWIISVVVTTSMAAAIMYSNHFASYREALLPPLIILLLYSFVSPYTGALIADNQLRLLTAVNLCISFVAFPLFYLTLKRAVSLSAVTSVYFVSCFLNAVALLIIAGRFNKVDFRLVSVAECRCLLKEAFPLMIIGIATQLYVRIDTLLLDWMLSEAAVGHYAALYRLLDSLMIISNFLMFAFFPKFMQTAELDNREFYSMSRRSLLFLMRFLTPLAIVLAVFASNVDIVLTGNVSKIGVETVRWLMLAAIFAWLNASSGMTMIAIHHEGAYAAATVISLVVNLTMNVILIPRYGARGAAMATAATELFLCSYCWIHLYRILGWVPLFHSSDVMRDPPITG